MRCLRIVKYAVAALAASTFVVGVGNVQAEPYPSANKITLIVAFAPGGVADTLARLIAQGLGDRLHQTVVVENRGGAGGNIAAADVARAAPDGYTLLATTTALAINETLFANKEFAASDFKTVAIAASSPEALVTSPGNPANNLADLIKAMNGKTINLAVPGVGTGSRYRGGIFLQVPRQSAGADHPVSRRRAGDQRHDRQPGRSDGDHARRRRRGADRRRQAQRSRHRRRQARRGRAECADLCRAGISRIHRRVLGRLLRAGQDRSARFSRRSMPRSTTSSRRLTSRKSSPIWASIRSPARRRRPTPCSPPKSRSGATWSRRWVCRSNSPHRYRRTSLHANGSGPKWPAVHHRDTSYWTVRQVCGME